MAEKPMGPWVWVSVGMGGGQLKNTQGLPMLFLRHEGEYIFNFVLRIYLMEIFLDPVKMQCAVCDGTSMGHPCCAVHNCQGPLPNNRHHYCAEHHCLNLQCAITDCKAPHDVGFKTCSDPDHRALENSHFQRGQAIFQLRSRLERAGVHVTKDTANISSQLDDIETEVLVECEGKAAGGNRKLRAYFGRRRTHNEQIIMRPCGVILSWATLFGSEGIASVNVRLLILFYAISNPSSCL